jgi:hypothetical protein
LIKKIATPFPLTHKKVCPILFQSKGEPQKLQKNFTLLRRKPRLPARSRFGEGRPHEACGGAMGFSPWSSTLRLSNGEKSLGNRSPGFLFFIGIMFIDKKANPPFKAEGVFIFHLFIA